MQSYQLKDVSDYGIDPSVKISATDAEKAVAGAEVLVMRIREAVT